MTQKPRDLIRPHTADGIQEYDNPMPRWWMGLFYFCIAFAVVYMLYYHAFGGSSLKDEYNSAAAVQSSLQAASASSPGSGPSTNLQAILSDPKAVAGGKETYETNCVPCHGALGQGGIGPNLTDKFWLHGGTAEAVYKTISEGVVEKGMLAWKPILGEEKVQHLVAFVMTLKGTNPPEPKAPQGSPED